jgi:hypothetical protein
MDWKATLRVFILGVMLLGDGKLFLSFISPLLPSAEGTVFL